MYALSVSLLRLVAAEGSEPRFMKEEEESSEEEEEELTPEEQGRHPLRFQWNTAIFFFSEAVMGLQPILACVSCSSPVYVFLPPQHKVSYTAVRVTKCRVTLHSQVLAERGQTEKELKCSVCS